MWQNHKQFISSRLREIIFEDIAHNACVDVLWRKLFAVFRHFSVLQTVHGYDVNVGLSKLHKTLEIPVKREKKENR